MDFKAAYRAVFHAGTAVHAFGVIDGRKVINDGNSFGRTVLLAFHTTYAGVFTFLAGNGAFFVVGAGDNGLFGFRDERNDMVWAGFCAHTASDAFSGIHAGDAVYDADSVILAFLCAVSTSEAAESTGTFSAIKHFRGGAGLYAFIYLFLIVYSAFAAAMYKSDNGFGFLGFNTEDGGDLFGNFGSAGTTEIGGCLTGGNGFCVSVTAGKTAGSAVCSGKAIADGNFGLVYRNSHDC